MNPWGARFCTSSYIICSIGFSIVVSNLTCKGWVCSVTSKKKLGGHTSYPRLFTGFCGTFSACCVGCFGSFSVDIGRVAVLHGADSARTECPVIELRTLGMVGPSLAGKRSKRNIFAFSKCSYLLPTKEDEVSVDSGCLSQNERVFTPLTAGKGVGVLDMFRFENKSIAIKSCDIVRFLRIWCVCHSARHCLQNTSFLSTLMSHPLFSLKTKQQSVR